MQEPKLFLVGSRLLRMDNCGDTDYCYFSKIRLPKEYKVHKIPMVAKLMQNFPKYLKYRNAKGSTSTMSVSNYYYQYSKCFHPEEDWPITWDIRDYKEDWIKMLKNHINSEEAITQYIKGKTFIDKKFYNIAYQYFMIRDNTVYLEGESKQIVQKIHDRQMPISYFYEMRELINAL